MKKLLVVLLLSICLVGCNNKNKENTITCTLNENKAITYTYKFYFDDFNTVNAIKEKILLDYSYYYTNEEIKELKKIGKLDGSQFKENVDCDIVGYVCTKTLEGSTITIEKYVSSPLLAQEAGLADFYEIEKKDIGTWALTNGASCSR